MNLKIKIKPAYITPQDTMRLEAARGLNEKGIRPSVQSYNHAIDTKKLLGKPIAIKLTSPENEGNN